MKSIYLKSSIAVSPVSELVKIGYIDKLKTKAHYKINNVPDDITAAEVSHKFYYTYVASKNKFEIDYSEIGLGKIIVKK